MTMTSRVRQWWRLQPRYTTAMVLTALVVGFCGAWVSRMPIDNKVLIERTVMLAGTVLVWLVTLFTMGALRGAEPERRRHRQQYRTGVYLLFAAFSGLTLSMAGLVNLRVEGTVLVPNGAIESLLLTWNLSWLVFLVGVAVILFGIIGGAKRTTDLKNGKFNPDNYPHPGH